MTVTAWITPGETISLGDRSLRVLHTPGHTLDSVSLVEVETGLIFSGDFIYPGPLFAFLPGSAMGDFLDGTKAILRESPVNPRILGAHRDSLSGLPELTLADVEDLEAALLQIQHGVRGGTGIYSVIYEVNDRMTVWGEPRWLQRW